MCCGDYQGLAEALAAPEGVLMAKVYSTVKGAVIQIGTYGEASNDSPAIVPDDVAAALAGQDGFKVELDEPKAHKPKKGEK